MPGSELFVGLMSGTSMDGVDAVLADFSVSPCQVLAHAYEPFSAGLRNDFNALQLVGDDEFQRGALAANALMDRCASAVKTLIAKGDVAAGAIVAVGVHGQTVRHHPELGFTIQLANPARLAEQTGIMVVADFRTRDVAAGGQGAPLVPAFHASRFGRSGVHRVVVNIGGIANVTDLPLDGSVRGFDTGPGNTLLDAWCERHTGNAFDRDGAWSAGGVVISELLAALRADPYFALPPPKSTGRDHFREQWLAPFLRPEWDPVGVARTLVELTVRSIADAIVAHAPAAGEILVCGGGAHNPLIMRGLGERLAPRIVATTAERGVPVDQVEALAFAWLAREALAGRPGNLPAVTGARGPRILGAIYPA
jgi:anhydro-N-acetylmuramic acid kinase